MNSARAAVTFNRDIAPLVWRECAPCHRAGQTAPFELVSYSDVSRHGKQILKVIEDDYMPPWPPERGHVKFQNERRLAPAEKKLLQDWIDGGAVEGDVKDLPPPPQWKDGWMLGKPDLVLTMPKAYTLGADGADLYRNFVIPVDLDRDRYVRAVEFAPGNARIVHHAFVMLDAAAMSRRQDGRDGAPGFGDMNVTAETPGGQFISWQPGRIPTAAPESFAWLLPKKSDVVLQVHMNRTGKPESLQSSVGLFFTDVVPTNRLFKMSLRSLDLRFPAGESNNVVTGEFTLPVEVEALAVKPHAHYLAREIEGFAILPDGRKQGLLSIKNWDFRWQGDYRYAEPIKLPSGTRLRMRFTYDNSTNNVNNPNNPPRLVSYGLQSVDEMCELWFQLLPKSPQDYATLKKAYEEQVHRMFVEHDDFVLKWNPSDPVALTSKGLILMSEGKTPQAMANFKRAIQVNPNLDTAHYHLGVLYRMTRRPREAKVELERAIELNGENAKAWGHLGFVFAELGNGEEAAVCFRKSLLLNPSDPLIQQALDELNARLGRR